jgi:hypothetical protein
MDTSPNIAIRLSNNILLFLKFIRAEFVNAAQIKSTLLCKLSTDLHIVIPGKNSIFLLAILRFDGLKLEKI